jgi:xanthosine utilization system XapX-like protein
MHWLDLVVSIVFIVIASRASTPGWLVVVLVLGSLGLFVGWMLGWMSQRVAGASRDDVQMLSPDELRHLREQAEARKAAAAAASRNPEEPAG